MQWPIDEFSAFPHPVAQRGHACSRRGLRRPGVFGRPLGIRKIVILGAAMQTRAEAASFIAYQFGEFQPGLLERRLTASGYFPSEINCVHEVSSVMGDPGTVRQKLAQSALSRMLKAMMFSSSGKSTGALQGRRIRFALDA